MVSPPERTGLSGSVRRARLLAKVVVVALGLLTVVLLGYPVEDLLTTARPFGLAAVGFAGLALAAVLHAAVIAAVLTGRKSMRSVQAAVAVETVLLLVLLTTMGGQWVQVPLFGLVDILLVAPGVWRVLGAMATVVAYGAVTARFYDLADWLASGGLWLLFTAICYGMVSLVRLAQELERARMGLATAAVGQERLRMARDLHDSLGHSLSVVLLKLELAQRLQGRDRERAAEEVGEACGLLRAAVEEMQGLVSGMRDRSLHAEIENVAAVLSAAGIDTTVRGPRIADLCPGADALAWVVREAATNILRHSSAIRCEIVVRRAADGLEVVVTNDGVPAAARPSSGGNGLDGLRERLTGVGGSLAVASEGSGEFVLTARAPLGAT